MRTSCLHTRLLARHSRRVCTCVDRLMTRRSGNVNRQCICMWRFPHKCMRCCCWVCVCMGLSTECLLDELAIKKNVMIYVYFFGVQLGQSISLRDKVPRWHADAVDLRALERHSSTPLPPHSAPCCTLRHDARPAFFRSRPPLFLFSAHSQSAASLVHVLCPTWLECDINWHHIHLQPHAHCSSVPDWCGHFNMMSASY